MNANEIFKFIDIRRIKEQMIYYLSLKIKSLG